MHNEKIGSSVSSALVMDALSLASETWGSSDYLHPRARRSSRGEPGFGRPGVSRPKKPKKFGKNKRK